MKINFRKSGERSSYRVWIMSYLFIMLIPMLFGTSIYLYALSTVRRQADMAQRETLQSVANISDRTMESVQQSTYAVLNTSLVSGLGMAAEYSTQNYQDMATVQNSMYKLKVNNSYIEEIYLYFAQTKYVLSTYSYSNADNKSLLDRLGMTFEELVETTSEVNYKTVQILSAENGPDLFLINSEISSSMQGEPRVTMLVQLKKEALLELMNMESSATYLVDAAGKVITHAPDGIPDELQAMFREGKEGLWQRGESYVRCIASESFDLFYVNELPRRLYFQDVDRMGTILVVYLLICIAVGGTLSVMLARKQYDPVKEILTTIQKANLTPEEKGDMGRIKSSIEQLLSEKENFKQRLQSQRRALRSSVMYNLIKGRHLERYLMEGIPYYKGDFHYDGGVLLAFDVEDASTAFLEEHEDLDDDLLDLVFYVVENIATELLEEHYQAFISEADGIMLCLVNVEEEKKDQSLAELNAISDRIVEFLSEKFGVKLSAGISSFHSNWSGIEKCYIDIQDIMDYRSVNGTAKPVISYAELEIFLQDESRKPECLEESVRAFLKEGSYEKAVSLIRENMEEKEPEPDKAGKEVRNEPRAAGTELVGEIREYIRKNYRDKDLSVGKIADEFGISLSYLSQIFKRVMQTGLLEYIHIQRIEEAKKLLLEGKSVQSVAEEVGYYNTRPLIRMFKRMENMTPTEYKESRKTG